MNLNRLAISGMPDILPGLGNTVPSVFDIGVVPIVQPPGCFWGRTAADEVGLCVICKKVLEDILGSLFDPLVFRA